VTSHVAEFQYKCTDFYAPGCEASIRWDDAQLGIDWPVTASSVLLSQKDFAANLFSTADVFD